MVDSTGKYFNEKIIEANKIDIPEFIRYTEIGKHQNRKKLADMREAEYVQETGIKKVFFTSIFKIDDLKFIKC